MQMRWELTRTKATARTFWSEFGSFGINVSSENLEIKLLHKWYLQSSSGRWEVAIPIPPHLPSKISDPSLLPDELDSNKCSFHWAYLDFLPCLFWEDYLEYNAMCSSVLSLKVFSLLKHNGQTKREALRHGLAYTVGVVLSFLLLAVLLFSLRAIGERVGWGFQLQSPSFLVFLAVLFFIFGLNLLGVFELGGRLVGADASVSKRHDITDHLLWVYLQQWSVLLAWALSWLE